MFTYIFELLRLIAYIEEKFLVTFDNAWLGTLLTKRFVVQIKAASSGKM